ncbi:MAG: hypothetical protein M1488_07270 [Gammaproteobacteria bacterium]|jgi:hypothetical protein|nr:hypothetical protein [Gammaproteobacteria bacterium]
MVIHWNTSRKAIISACLNKVGPSNAHVRRSSGGKPLACCQPGSAALKALMHPPNCFQLAWVSFASAALSVAMPRKQAHAGHGLGLIWQQN